VKDETQRLLAKSRESLQAAELLAQRHFFDSAASRAYYAMFYVAEALLFELGERFSKHSAVHAAFGQHFAKPGKHDPKFHRYLLEAFDQRLVGDYEVTSSVSEHAARDLLDHTREFLAAAETYLAKP